MITEAARSDHVFRDPSLLLVPSSAHLHSQILSYCTYIYKCLTPANAFVMNLPGAHPMTNTCPNMNKPDEFFGAPQPLTTFFLRAPSTFPLKTKPLFSKTERSYSPKFAQPVFQKGFHFSV